MRTTYLESIKNNIFSGTQLGAEEITTLIKHTDKITLYKTANEIREYYCGKKFEMCSITNAKSGLCSEDCKWCSQSAHHSCPISTYNLLAYEKIENEAHAVATKKVARHSLVASGKQLDGIDFEQILSYFKKLSDSLPIKLCASLGLLNKEQLKQLKQAGVSRYHCNIETAPSFFKHLCTTHTLEEKIQTIQWAKEAGLEICSGVIIGMGETMEQRIEMALFLRDLQVDSIPLNVLHAIPGTALAHLQPLSEDEVLTAIAIFRFLNPTIPIRLAGGRVIIKNYEQKALLTGANAAIVGDLLTTVASTIDEDIKLFKETGFEI